MSNPPTQSPRPANYRRACSTSRLLWLSVAILLVATGLRAWHLGTQSIWFDEGFSWHAATQPSLIASLNGDPTNPPLYYVKLHIWVRLTGTSEFSMRAMSLLQGIILLAVMSRTARRWFGRGAGVTAAGIGAFLPLLWWASQEARMYNTLALGVLIMAMGMMDILDKQPPDRRSWLLLITGELAALYSHNTGIVIAVALNLAFAILWITRHRSDTLRWALLRSWVLGQIVVGILWLPEFFARFVRVGTANTGLSTTGAFSPGDLWNLWQALFASSWEMVRAADPSLQTAALIAGVLAFPMLLSLQRPRGRTLLTLTVALLAMLLIATQFLGVTLHGRYLVMLTPLLVIAISGGVSSLANPTLRQTLQVGITLAIALIWFWLPGRPSIAYQHDQARDIVQHYAATLDTDDIVLSWSYAERYELAYYWQQWDVQASLVTLTEGADADEIISTVNNALPEHLPARAAQSIWYTQRADARGMLSCLLANGNAAPAPAYTVNGMSSQTYSLSGPLADQTWLASDSVNFGTISLVQTQMPQMPVQADKGLCLPLEFTINDTTADNLRVAVKVLNSLGWEIATSDAPLMTAVQQPTSRLHPGDTVQAYPLVYLPPGTPPGSYDLQLRVYSQQNLSGLDVRDPATGAPGGKNLPLGVVKIAAAQWAVPDDGCGMALGGSVTLEDCAALPTAETLDAGQLLRLTLLLRTPTAPAPVTVRLQGDSWQVESTEKLAAEGLVLNWRALQIPADASGQMTLSVQVGDEPAVTLGEYDVVAPEHQMTAPQVGRTSAIAFPQLGTIYGYTIANDTIRSDSSFDVSIAWQASAATDVGYAISVQLLDSEGRLLAQHDSQPAEGSRPTTGWAAGEYIVDNHRITFRPESVGYSGQASLIVAVYNPSDGSRLRSDSGSDFALLASGLSVSAP